VKFPEVPVGGRFRYQGETLIKIGPMTACNERGGEARLIPRSAVVTPAGATPEVPPVAPILTPALVRKALAAFDERLRSAIGALDHADRGPIEAALEAARRDLAERLGLGADPGP
jgi:hypothetical protein